MLQVRQSAPVPKDTTQISWGKPSAFLALPPDLQPRALMDMDFAIRCSLVRSRLPRYPVAVRRDAISFHTSFRRSLAVPPLCFTRASPPSGCTGDFHPQNCRTCPTHRLALRAPALRAATALTRPNRSAQRLPCGRHSAPTAATVGPNDVIDCAKREHLRNPSLLMRARAQATVRVWKKRPELQAHSRIGIRGGCGLPVATGAVS